MGRRRKCVLLLTNVLKRKYQESLKRQESKPEPEGRRKEYFPCQSYFPFLLPWKYVCVCGWWMRSWSWRRYHDIQGTEHVETWRGLRRKWDPAHPPASIPGERTCPRAHVLLPTPPHIIYIFWSFRPSVRPSVRA